MTDDPWSSLTPREQEVAKMIAVGLTRQEITAALSISPKTVDTHRGHILTKLHLENAVPLSRWMLRRNLVVLNEGDVT